MSLTGPVEQDLRAQEGGAQDCGAGRLGCALWRSADLGAGSRGRLH